jgi:cation:H+ antiporter
MQFILLILGLAFIIKSADILVDSVSKLARRYGISTFIIAITVIAFGTSTPEFAVGIISGISHTNELTLGDILGSSMANMGLIAGLSAVIYPLRMKDAVLKRELPVLFAVQLFLGVMILTDGRLSRFEGILLLCLFFLYMAYIARDTKKSARIQIDSEGDIDTDGNGNNVPEHADDPKKNALLKLWAFSLLSFIGLFIGGRLTVYSSTRIAESFGLSQTLIGLTVVALATSMPELITSLIAARKKEPDIVLGNCIGSNILNILLVLGLSSTISPIAVHEQLLFDMISIVALTVFVFIISLKQRMLRQTAGIIMLVGYAAYIAVKVSVALL